MSNIIGQFVPDESEHPRELVDALYAEIFDQYEADDEIDVALVLEKVEGPVQGVKVVDFHVLRVTEETMPEFYDPEDDDNNVDKAPFLGYAKKVDAWVRDRLDPEHPLYWFIHKHPEEAGFRASGKDRILNAVLSQIDISRGQHIAEPETMEIRMERTFMGFITVNRNNSSRVRAQDRVPPLGDYELDMMYIEKSGTAMGECFEAVLGRDKALEYWDALETVLPLFREAHQQKHGDGAVSEDVERRFKIAMDRLMEVGDRLDAEGRKKLGLPEDEEVFPNLPPEIAQMIQEMTQQLSEQIDTTGLGKLLGGAVITPDGITPFNVGGTSKPKGEDPFPPLFAPQPEQLGPALPSPKQPLAADHHESPSGRPDVPDIFGDLDFPEINFFD